MRGRIENDIPFVARGDSPDEAFAILVVFEGHELALDGETAVRDPVAGGALRIVIEQKNRIGVCGELAGEIDGDGGLAAAAFEIENSDDQGGIALDVANRAEQKAGKLSGGLSYG